MQRQTVRRLPLQHKAAAVQLCDLRLFQQTNKAPASPEVGQNTFHILRTGPAQRCAGLPLLIRPAETLPAFFLVEIFQLLAVNHQMRFHHVTCRFCHQFKMYPGIAAGKGCVGHIAQAIQGA